MRLITFIVAYVLYVAIETSSSGWMATELHGVGYSQSVGSLVTAGFWTSGGISVAVVSRKTPGWWAQPVPKAAKAMSTNRIQFPDGLSTWSMTRISIGSLRGSSFSPICSCMAVKIDPWLESSVLTAAIIGEDAVLGSI